MTNAIPLRLKVLSSTLRRARFLYVMAKMDANICALEVVDRSGVKTKTKKIGGADYRFITALKRKDTAAEMRDSLNNMGIPSRYRRDPKSGLYIIMADKDKIANSNINSDSGKIRKVNAKVKVKSKGRSNKMNNTKPNLNARMDDQSGVRTSVSTGMPKLKILTSNNCSGCKQIEKSLADDIKANKISVLSVDTKEGREIANKLGAKYVPTFIIDDAREVCMLDDKGQKTKCVPKNEGKSVDQGKGSNNARAKTKSKQKLKMKKG